MSVYLDHAATTPVDPVVSDAMRPFLEAEFGNPSSLHARGRAARTAVETAREQVADSLGVTPLEVLFTSGGTEADNQALKGVAWASRAAGQGSHRAAGRANHRAAGRANHRAAGRANHRAAGRANHIVITGIEHSAVLESAEWLAAYQGFELTVVPCEPDGVVDPDRLLAAVRDDTVCVSVMTANNELGTVQPVDVIGPALADRGVTFHTDAVQAFGRLPLDPDAWGVDALALSAHKFNGPKGVGVLMLRRDVPAHSVLHGGGQERGVRSGTLNTPGIVGCGAAAELAASAMPTEIPRLTGLRDRLLDGLLAVEGVTLNGSRQARLPHNAHVAVPGCDGEALLLALDAAGVAASTGSACQSGAAEPSHVLRAVGAPTDDVAHVRFTCGRTTDEAGIDAAVEAFTDAVKRLRDAGGGFL